MNIKTGTLAKSIAGAMALAFLAGPAAAGSLKDTPMMSPERALAWSANVAATSEYVFRGISQTDEKPTVQGGIDVTYGILYAGIWASGLDFGENSAGRDIATTEIDLVAGIKPKWGPVSFDFGVIYYVYPGARDSSAELNMVELKAGASVEPWAGGTLGITTFYSPDYTGELGDVWTFEGTIAHAFPAIHGITPTFSALIGYQKGDDNSYASFYGADDYLYWNVGVTFAFHERFSIDVRYWDTDLDATPAGACLTSLFQCDERVVATAKVTF
jgi:uncharacterized protein (TIGR02001 family)